MSLREKYRRAHPGFPWLECGDVAGVGTYLRSAGWLEAGEQVRGCDRAGDGNMNLTLRIRTDRRRFILKQARPWVEKYDTIEAPWDRCLSEIAFYERVRSIRSVAARMPRLLGCDRDARVILLEDLPAARDLADLYSDAGGTQVGTADHTDDRTLHAEELQELALILRDLHAETEGQADPALANRAMRELNHQHIFEIPMSGQSDQPLDGFEPGLGRAAAGLRENAGYREKLRRTGSRYLENGRCLVHGDYFPGSWLRSDLGLRVIDPEFGFFGDPELDLGFAVAHFALADLPAAAARLFLESYAKSRSAVKTDPAWTARYAASEIMRRLIGVAQLPIPPSRGFRVDLLERSQRVMESASLEPLWEAN